MKKIKTLRIILGDQLLASSAIIQEADKKSDCFLMMEVMDEITSVKHHKIKVVLILSAMRHFAKALIKKGYKVRYIEHDDPDNQNNFPLEIERAVVDMDPERIAYTLPGEYRISECLKALSESSTRPWQVYIDEKFYTQPDDFAEWAKGRKQLTMEYFYREQRKRFNILLESGKPLGGQWNYDKNNRKKAPKGYQPNPPFRVKIDDITKGVMHSLKGCLDAHPGDWSHFHLAVTRADAQRALAYFIEHNLPTFGDYQDAMLTHEPWMSHSHLSFYLNIGLLTPHECIAAALDSFKGSRVDINSVEGFIRQILGWREYIRGLYWLKMPGYADCNRLQARRDLPDFFWHGQTSMHCLKQSIGQTLKYAYAHHIQRLMVIGNFCLLVGIQPSQVSHWYLAIYADAFEWVELPNVVGMILFADDGILATKPYAAGGNYIHKMSNYCSRCEYSVKDKVGEKACPFNYLYWHFIDKHQDKFLSNPRMALIIKRWQGMDAQQKEAVRASAEKFLEQL